ncbi:MAG: hypothetical protein NUW01_15845, partial [Gemmatimonadaceae bacterium]|nr:hypothetical protein [Gemmatimonadaceae bacterium]
MGGSTRRRAAEAFAGGNPITGLLGRGGDGGTEAQEVDADELLARLAAGEELSEEELAALRQSLGPAEADILLGAGGSADEDLDFGDLDGGEDFGDVTTPSLSGGEEYDSIDEGLDLALRSILDAEGYETQSQKARAFAELANARAQLAELSEGNMTLDDGTIITQAMIDGADPLTRAQLMQELDERQRAVRNEATGLLNQYGLDQYNLQRQQSSDRNAAAQATFSNQITSVRERLARDDLNIEQAVSAISRMLDGLGESRSRAEFETETAQA